LKKSNQVKGLPKKCVFFQVKVSLGSKRKSLKGFFGVFEKDQFETHVEFASL